MQGLLSASLPCTQTVDCFQAEYSPDAATACAQHASAIQLATATDAVCPAAAAVGLSVRLLPCKPGTAPAAVRHAPTASYSRLRAADAGHNSHNCTQPSKG
eukprot:GHRQ01025521.1.p2 GENE.GHRQ01025521.1~~GHRQ01025521.1.p2  ORF type:complete len:101 (+),score=28.87 GHRQ01025521.1:1403-1705(+)